MDLGMAANERCYSLFVLSDWHLTMRGRLGLPRHARYDFQWMWGRKETDDQKRSQRSSAAGDPLAGTPNSLRAAANAARSPARGPAAGPPGDESLFANAPAATFPACGLNASPIPPVLPRRP